MKEQHLNNLIDKLKEYSYNFIKNDWIVFNTSTNISLNACNCNYTYTDTNKLNIFLNIRINAEIDGESDKYICNFVYNLDKSKQIEYLSLRNKKDITNFIKTIRTSRNYYY